jgi:hypothetical protein
MGTPLVLLSRPARNRVAGLSAAKKIKSQSQPRPPALPVWVGRCCTCVLNGASHGAGSSDTIDGDSSGNIYPGTVTDPGHPPPIQRVKLNKSTTRWGRGGPHLSLRWSRGLSVCIARLVKWSI